MGWVRGTFKKDVVDQDEHGRAIWLREQVHNFPLRLVLDVLIDLSAGSCPILKICGQGLQLIVVLGVCWEWFQKLQPVVKEQGTAHGHFQGGVWLPEEVVEMPEGPVDLNFGHLSEVEAQALEKLLPCVASGTQGQHS